MQDSSHPDPSPLPSPPWDPYEAGRKATEAMTRVGGEALSREQASERLGISLAALYDRINAREIVLWTDHLGPYRFPNWQFCSSGLVPGVLDCLRLLDCEDHWAVMRFFLAPSEMSGDVSPIDLIRAGRIEEAKAIAAAAGRESPSRFARIHALARQIFSTDDAVAQWLRAPAPALAGQTPLALINTDAGAREVEAVLQGIAAGNVM